jgi:hypothetical protein
MKREPWPRNFSALPLGRSRFKFPPPALPPQVSETPLATGSGPGGRCHSGGAPPVDTSKPDRAVTHKPGGSSCDRTASVPRSRARGTRRQAPRPMREEHQSRFKCTWLPGRNLGPSVHTSQTRPTRRLGNLASALISSASPSALKCGQVADDALGRTQPRPGSKSRRRANVQPVALAPATPRAATQAPP